MLTLTITVFHLQLLSLSTEVLQPEEVARICERSIKTEKVLKRPEKGGGIIRRKEEKKRKEKK